METLNEQARRLASGTIASLTSLRAYRDIDVVRVAFVSFCDGLDRKPEKWQDAWELFELSCGVEKALQM
jgi:hypothetical protein